MLPEAHKLVLTVVVTGGATDSRLALRGGSCRKGPHAATSQPACNFDNAQVELAKSAACADLLGAGRRGRGAKTHFAQSVTEPDAEGH